MPPKRTSSSGRSSSTDRKASQDSSTAAGKKSSPARKPSTRATAAAPPMRGFTYFAEEAPVRRQLSGGGVPKRDRSVDELLGRRQPTHEDDDDDDSPELNRRLAKLQEANAYQAARPQPRPVPPASLPGERPRGFNYLAEAAAVPLTHFVSAAVAAAPSTTSTVVATPRLLSVPGKQQQQRRRDDDYEADDYDDGTVDATRLSTVGDRSTTGPRGSFAPSSSAVTGDTDRRLSYGRGPDLSPLPSTMSGITPMLMGGLLPSGPSTRGSVHRPGNSPSGRAPAPNYVAKPAFTSSAGSVVQSKKSTARLLLELFAGAAVIWLVATLAMRFGSPAVPRSVAQPLQ